MILHCAVFQVNFDSVHIIKGCFMAIICDVCKCIYYTCTEAGKMRRGVEKRPNGSHMFVIKQPVTISACLQLTQPLCHSEKPHDFRTSAVLWLEKSIFSRIK